MSVETGSMQTRTLAIANRKGGTGKSTLTVNLAAELGSRGYRVLVVDIDPQGHAGLGFGIRSTDAENTSHVAFRKPWADLVAAVRPTSEPGVDLIAADRISVERSRSAIRAASPKRCSRSSRTTTSFCSIRPQLPPTSWSARCSPPMACWCRPGSTIWRLTACGSSARHFSRPRHRADAS
jgi:chromosome partitioning protein